MSEQHDTAIRWTHGHGKRGRTWNPIRGCSVVSPGCTNCYAMSTAYRFSKPGRPFEGFARRVNGRAVWTGKVETLPYKLREPFSWREPSMCFVNSMADLFHELVPFEFIDQVFAVMAWCPQHTFQILTKRPDRMRQYLTEKLERNASDYQTAPERADRISSAMCDQCMRSNGRLCGFGNDDCQLDGAWLPLGNVWLGTSIEDQRRADERIPILLETPAIVRFLSMEPLLGPVDLDPYLWEEAGPTWAGRNLAEPGLDWVIVGGESGTHYRPMDFQWARDLRDQCLCAGVPFFFKQSSGPRTEMGQELDGQRWEQWPA